MAIAGKIKKFLDEKHVTYQILQHSLAYTAMEIAGAQHVPGKQMIKSVIVNADNRFIMCVLCSTYRINFAKLKKILGVKDLYLATETEVEQLFPDLEIGAEPPFGGLYGLETYIDRAVSENEIIVFNGGTHTETIKMNFNDFSRLANAKTANFAERI